MAPINSQTSRIIELVDFISYKTNKYNNSEISKLLLTLATALHSLGVIYVLPSPAARGRGIKDLSLKGFRKLPGTFVEENYHHLLPAEL